MQRNIRRSQAVVPFGVGAIIDLEDEALMAAGLDAWPEEPKETLLDDRLAARLRVAYFRQPPPRPGTGRRGENLPFVRFPYWHFCPRCRALERLQGVAPKRPPCSSNVVSPVFKTAVEPCASRKRRPRVLPLRFVIACKEGHIEDFPWIEWAHSGEGEQLVRGLRCPGVSSEAPAPALFFYPTSRGGLSGLVVHCKTCDRKRSLLASSGRRALDGFGCAGHRPWLGPAASESCGASDPPQVLQRGASNVYFPSVSSSVLIPPFSRRARQVVDDPTVWGVLNSVTDGGRIPEAHIEMVAKLKGIESSEFAAAVRSKESGEGTASENDSEEAYRFAEYTALQRRSDSPTDQLLTSPQQIADYSAVVRDLFDGVVLVEALAETRVLTGFTRIEPPGSRDVRPAVLRKRSGDWLPAYRVQGEGIFLIVKRSRLTEWCSALGDGLTGLLGRARVDPRVELSPTAELVALHTMAHLLILRLSFEAGYGTSSIRERLYVSAADSPTPMSGMLLYTAAGDADGTLGGLVRQGKPRNLDRVLGHAVADAQWCSADPVCRESPGQGIGSLNLAACHACALLPETSCEMGNRLLDRLAVVGVSEQDRRPGLFSDLDAEA